MKIIPATDRSFEMRYLFFYVAVCHNCWFVAMVRHILLLVCTGGMRHIFVGLLLGTIYLLGFFYENEIHYCWFVARVRDICWVFSMRMIYIIVGLLLGYEIFVVFSTGMRYIIVGLLLEYEIFFLRE